MEEVSRCFGMTQAPDPNDQPSSTPPLNEQLADIALKVVITGGVAGGGLGAFWSLFKESDVPKAIASAVIGLGISYAAKMLQPIHEGNQRRLENTGKAIDRTIDNSTRFVIDKISGGTIEDRYLACQAAECQRLRSEGVAQHQGIFIPLLQEVFVPLALGVGASFPGFKPLPNDLTSDLEIDAHRDLTIWDFLRKASQQPTFRQLVILAWGGYGKTTLLKHIAYIYGTRQHQRRYNVPKRIPILLMLRKYRDVLTQQNPPSLPELIATRHIPDLPEAADLQVSLDWVKQILKAGEVIVLLDGFDEVAKGQRPAVARWINQQMRQYGQSIFILTSRPKAYTKQDAADRLELATPLWVQDFNAKQRQDFVERWYLCQERYASGGDNTPDVRQIAMRAATELLEQIEARQELKGLAKNPLLLNMMVTFHRRYPGAELPKRPVELYREMCLLQLRDRPAARELETLLTQCDAQTILQMLALEMMQRKEELVDQETLLERLTQYLTSQDETVAATEFLQQIEQISELIVQREPEEFEFAHLSFQEYLAAREVVRLKQESLLYDRFNDDWWKPTILLYAAQVKPGNLIREMLRRGATNLAYLCYQETTKQVAPALKAELDALKQTVQTSRYTKLEEYLRQGQWEAADNETYRLMITTVGKEEEQLFEPDELLNFPCEELLAIDGLWVKYSKGKFGFSVQKDIYLECGGIPDRQYKEAVEEFGDRVCWRTSGSWEFRMIYDTSAPRGHLPASGFWRVGGVGFGWWGWVSSLASRIINCSR